MHGSEPLFGASSLLGGMDPIFLPSFEIEKTRSLNVALDVAAAAPGIQEIGTIITLATCWGLFFEEINKFFWWPLHLSGYLLVVVPVLLFIGVHLLRAEGVTVAAGVVILVTTSPLHRLVSVRSRYGDSSR